MRRRGPVGAAAAPEFAAMIESVILRCVSSASFAFATESRSFAASMRLRTASAIRTESSREITGLGGFARRDTARNRRALDETFRGLRCRRRGDRWRADGATGVTATSSSATSSA